MLNSSVNEELVAAGANVKEGDVVLEIGIGSLTNVLIEFGVTLLAIEKDPYMAEAELVRERFASVDNVKDLQEDFTRCHVRSHLLPYLEGNSLDRSSRAPLPFWYS